MTSLSTYPALTHSGNGVTIELNYRGSNAYTKVSYPVKYGIFSRLETPGYIFEFDLNGCIRHARSKSREWPHPSEWLKRTMGNDWIYYSSGGYAGVFEAIGEYYLPNLMYRTNSLLGGKPFEEPVIAKICRDWPALLAEVPASLPGAPGAINAWLRQVRAVTPGDLAGKATALFDVSGARTTVLPPDARHSDYSLIPLTIADGCLYKCRFCKVKNKKPFTPRTEADIRRQITELKTLYAKDLINTNALFLGEHDALNAPAGLLIFAAQTAFEEFGFSKSYMKQPRLYFFGSVDSLLNADQDLFKTLDRLPFDTCINIGLESFDPQTLDRIGKPITADKVGLAFDRIQDLNRTFPSLELTCNFIMDDGLPPSHTRAMLELVRNRPDRNRPKGSVYLSPLAFGRPSREVLMDFYRLKTQSRLPMFLYIIQRL